MTTSLFIKLAQDGVNITEAFSTQHTSIDGYIKLPLSEMSKFHEGATFDGTSIVAVQKTVSEVTYELLASIRMERITRLAQSDWTQMPDNPLTPAQVAQWATYRQALRDVTAQPDLTNITWPKLPI